MPSSYAGGYELVLKESPKVSAAAESTGTGRAAVMHLGITVGELTVGDRTVGEVTLRDVRAAVAEFAAAGVPVHLQSVEAYGTTFADVEAPPRPPTLRRPPRRPR
jgi:hypothetical protein